MGNFCTLYLFWCLQPAVLASLVAVMDFSLVAVPEAAAFLLAVFLVLVEVLAAMVPGGVPLGAVVLEAVMTGGAVVVGSVAAVFSIT
jgi:hypothetical protein